MSGIKFRSRWLRAFIVLGVVWLRPQVTSAAELPSGQEVLKLFQEERFDELEKLAGELRQEKLEFYRGYSKLSRLYGYLDGPSRNADDGVWTQHIARLEKWSRVQPQSVTSRIALANTCISYAWKARGGGYANEVTQQGWRLFGTRLTQARNWLEEADELPARDPELYRALIVVAMAEGWPTEQMDKVFRKGVKIEPNYLPLYEAKAYFLLPRWNGEAGEWEAFADEAARERGDEEGEILYMAIARSQAWSEREHFFERTRISYERMKKGFEASLRRSPGYLWDMNSYCYFASVAGDRERAKSLFEEIGDRWERDVWRNENEFRQWQNWALNNGPRPVASTRTASFRGGVTPERVKSLLLVGGAIWLGAILVIGLGVWLLAKGASRSNNKPPPLPRQ